jgi:hypothetical protein
MKETTTVIPTKRIPTKPTEQEPPSSKSTNSTAPSNLKSPPPGSDEQSTTSSKTIAVKDAIVNDGTYRFTMQWNPNNFEDLKEIGALWNQAFVPILKLLLDHPKAQIHAWDGKEKTVTTVKDVNEFNVRKFLSPSISPAYSQKTFYFGMRVCFSDIPPQRWLSEAKTKASLKEHKIRLSVSNSACDSGKLITAGFIFLKHPSMTHRHRYLQSLRSELPESTPHFDILTHRKTPDDEAVPHLAVRCGEKHILGLTEILSSHLCGVKRTAGFVGRLAFQEMGAATVKQLFATQKKFIASLVRMPIPLMTNVDRSRLEHAPDGNVIERSMRQWAETLTDAKGVSMQCDVENGGKDRNAYLLTPRHHSEAVKIAYREYRERVHPFKQREQRFHAALSQESTGCPNAIYVPTQAVRSNISFLQGCTAAEHWKQAPATVKTKTAAPVSVTQTQLPDDVTVATSASTKSHLSTATTKQSSVQSEFETKFAQLEASMNEQSAALLQSSELATSRFSQLEAQMLKAMTHSNNAMEAVTNLNEKVDQLTKMMTQVTNLLGARDPQPTIAILPDDSSTTTSEASHMKSPAHKKSKSTKPEAPSDDQYKDPSSEAGGEKC